MSTFADEARPEPAAEQLAPDGAPAEIDDDVIVLPWWQHPLNILTVVVATALIAGMIGWLVGDAAAERDGDDVDIGFLQDMREHHEQAVAIGLLFLDLEGTDGGLRTIARSIVMGQSIEIGRMIQLLRDLGAAEVNEGETSMGWMGMSAGVGQMPGMASEAQLEQLAAATGRDADEQFTALMIAHHRGAIDMAEYASEHADDDEVRAMAESMAHSQADEIGELQGVLG